MTAKEVLLAQQTEHARQLNEIHSAIINRADNTNDYREDFEVNRPVEDIRLENVHPIVRRDHELLVLYLTPYRPWTTLTSPSARQDSSTSATTGKVTATGPAGEHCLPIRPGSQICTSTCSNPHSLERSRSECWRTSRAIESIPSSETPTQEAHGRMNMSFGRTPLGPVGQISFRSPIGTTQLGILL